MAGCQDERKGTVTSIVTPMVSLFSCSLTFQIFSVALFDSPATCWPVFGDGEHGVANRLVGPTGQISTTRHCILVGEPSLEIVGLMVAFLRRKLYIHWL